MILFSFCHDTHTLLQSLYILLSVVEPQKIKQQKKIIIPTYQAFSKMTSVRTSVGLTRCFSLAKRCSGFIHFWTESSSPSVKMLDVRPHNWHNSSCTSPVQMEGFRCMGKAWNKIEGTQTCQSWRRPIGCGFWTESTLAQLWVMNRCWEARKQTWIHFLMNRSRSYSSRCELSELSHPIRDQ